MFNCDTPCTGFSIVIKCLVVTPRAHNHSSFLGPFKDMHLSRSILTINDYSVEDIWCWMGRGHKILTLHCKVSVKKLRNVERKFFVVLVEVSEI